MSIVSEHLPKVIVIALAFLVVTVLCAFCIMCQFEYRRKKYLLWRKNAPCSGYSTPTANAHAYVPIEEIETAASSVENLVTPGMFARERREKLIRSRLNAASKILKRHFHKSRGRRRRPRLHLSLPGSPYLQVKGARSQSQINLMDPSPKGITGGQVRKALRDKSRRYRHGHFRPLNRPCTPTGSPNRVLAEQHRRHSRSLSDIIDLVSLEAAIQPPLNVTVVSSSMASRHRPPQATIAQMMPPPSRMTLRSVISDFPSGSEISRSAGESSDAFTQGRRRRLLDKRAKEKLIESRNRRQLKSASRHSMASTLSNGSLTTLKATNANTASLSELSEHSVMSGDQELEFDLYDCDLNNVSNLPGSMFAPANLYYDLTPTAEEEFELTELFPKMREDKMNNEALINRKLMVDSLTSDLAVSITSEDLTTREAVVAPLLPKDGDKIQAKQNGAYVGVTLDSSCYHSDDDEDGDRNHAKETDKLLRKTAILNLTHIDDDISFADADAEGILS